MLAIRANAGASCCHHQCMTIAVLIKVNDGIVLASDSATTLTMTLPDGSQQVANIYNNANKVFNLHKELPIGAMTWGLGNIGPSSIATLAKDLRRRFQFEDLSTPGWSIDVGSYAIDEVAGRAREFLHDERYVPEVATKTTPPNSPPELGFLVAGYSSNSDEPHAFVMKLGDPHASPLEEILPQDTGAAWWGQPDAIARILNGVSLAVPEALVNLGIGIDLPQAVQVYRGMATQLNQQMIQPAMPIQDAIDLAEFEIATITKHEGFRWVRRKHFFDNRLNQ